MSQLEISFEERRYPLKAKELQVGQVFKKADNPAVYMKVKSVNFLNNSNLLSGVFARGDILTVNLHKGTLFVMSGETCVVKLKGKMQLERIKDND